MTDFPMSEVLRASYLWLVTVIISQFPQVVFIPHDQVVVSVTREASLSLVAWFYSVRNKYLILSDYKHY